MITMPKFNEPEAEVKLTSNLYQVILLKSLSIEDTGKEATRLRSYFYYFCLRLRATSTAYVQ